MLDPKYHIEIRFLKAAATEMRFKIMLGLRAADGQRIPLSELPALIGERWDPSFVPHAPPLYEERNTEYGYHLYELFEWGSTPEGPGFWHQLNSYVSVHLSLKPDVIPEPTN